MSNLLTLTQDEIDRWGIKGKVPGDVITAEEYSKYQKEYEADQDKPEVDTSNKTSARTPSKK